MQARSDEILNVEIGPPFARYRKLVRPKDAIQFWEIRPSEAKDKLVAFPQEVA